MNRLVRIALTLFVSATVMVFLINRRLVGLQEFRKFLTPDARLSDTELDRIHNEVIMINVGFVLIGIMLAAGLALIITAMVRAKKKPAAHG